MKLKKKATNNSRPTLLAHVWKSWMNVVGAVDFTSLTYRPHRGRKRKKERKGKQASVVVALGSWVRRLSAHSFTTQEAEAGLPFSFSQNVPRTFSPSRDHHHLCECLGPSPASSRQIKANLYSCEKRKSCLLTIYTIMSYSICLTKLKRGQTGKRRPTDGFLTGAFKELFAYQQLSPFSGVRQ